MRSRFKAGLTAIVSSLIFLTNGLLPASAGQSFVRDAAAARVNPFPGTALVQADPVRATSLAGKQDVAPNPNVYQRGGQSGQGFRASRYLAYPKPARETIARRAASPAPTGAHKVLAVMMDFTDVHFAPGEDADFYRGLLYGATNSLASFYNRNSYGALTITGDVFSVTSAHPMSYYGRDQDPGSGDDSYYGDVTQMAVEAVQKLKAQNLDLSQYDTNHDGIIDHFMLIHAGSGQEEVSDSANELIWSHRADITPTLVDTSHTVNAYATVPADGKLGVLAHEFGHDLGLPDLYDTDESDGANSNGAGLWDLMAAGSWLGGGATPAGLSAWSKAFLGWVTPTVVASDGTYSINDSDTYSNGVFRLWKDGSAASHRYFLIENRQDPNLTAGGLGTGLLVWRINDDAGSVEYNNVNADPDNLRVGLVEADAADPLDADGLKDLYDQNNEGDPGDPFRSTNKTQFNAITIPNSYEYGPELSKGAWPFVEINNISASASTMTAWLGVRSAVPALPTPSGPSGAIGNNTPAFTWNYVNKAESYHLQIAASAAFEPGTVLVDAAGLQQLSYTPPTLAPNTYYWRLAAVNALNSGSPAYTAPVSFAVKNVPVINPIASPNNHNPLVVPGTAPIGSTVKIYVDGSGTPAAAVTAADGTFSASLPLADGTHTINATFTDVLSNVSPVSSTITVVIDTAAPAAPTLSATANSATHTFPVSGTAEAGSTVSVYQSTDQSSTANLLGTATTAGNGAYTAQVTVPSDADYTIVAQAADAAGNQSALSSAVTVAVNAPPEITDRVPAANAADVAITVDPIFFFNEDVVADSVYSAVYSTNVQLKNGLSLIPATISYDLAAKKVTIQPLSDLAKGTTYTIAVTGVTDLTGLMMADTFWSFTTVESSGGGVGGGGGASLSADDTLSATVKPGEAGQLTSGALQLDIPAGASAATLTAALSTISSSDSDYSSLNKLVEAFAGKQVSAFDLALTPETGSLELKKGLTLTFKTENLDKTYGYYRFDPVFNTLVPLKTVEKAGLIETAITVPGRFIVVEEGSLSFSDLPADSWSTPYIYRLAQKNILSGMNGAKFSPSQQLTRGQLAKIIALADAIPGANSSAGFTDVTSQRTWAFRYINSVKMAGVIDGYQDGSFKPDRPVTRAELVKIVVVAAGLTAEGQANYPDTKGHWADKYIAAAATAGIISGYSDGSFKPDASVTREEAAKIIALATGYGE